MTPSRVRVLSIAGSDPSGGAGIQADLKSIAAQGGYGMAALTALTAQNTTGVQGVFPVPSDFVAAQLDSVAADVAIDAVKLGMLANESIISVVAQWISANNPPLVVLDPVMVATSGDVLLDADARSAILDLLRLADVVTPNLPELAVLLGEPTADTWGGALSQGRSLAAEYDVVVVLKGGHLPGDQTPDALVWPDGAVDEFDGVRIETTNTHGTGCSLASATATRFAGTSRDQWAGEFAVVRRWLRAAIAAGEYLQVGSGAASHGPVDHLVDPSRWREA